MNIHRCCTLRNLILAAALGIGLTSSALAQTRALFVDLNSKKAIDLGVLGGDYSSASGINDMGQVAGYSDTDNGERHAFITGPDGVGKTELGTLGGTWVQAFGINDAGRVVGESITENGLTHAFITGPDGVGMTDLGTLGGDYSGASGINNEGQVVGVSTTDNGQGHAFITGPDGIGMTDLGTLGEGSSYAFGINDAGQVVGHSDTDTSLFLPFVTGPDGAGMTELASLVNPPPGFTDFSYAGAINNHGQLAAVAVVPEPEMYAMLLLGLGLISFLARGRATHSRLPSQA